jgi:hypothetical protein
MSGISKRFPDWDQLLAAACRVQAIVPEAVLGGGCAVILYTDHRMSYDADYSMRGLNVNFDEILRRLESESGWKTN